MDADDERIVDFDVEALFSAARAVVGDKLRVCVAYSAEEFRVIHVGDLVKALYANEEEMLDHFGRIHDYVNIDFAERDLFEDLFRAGGVHSFTTYMESVILVRILVNQREGLFMALDPGTDVTTVVDAVSAAADGGQ